jgi:hypothetical protein
MSVDIIEAERVWGKDKIQGASSQHCGFYQL